MGEGLRKEINMTEKDKHIQDLTRKVELLSKMVQALRMENEELEAMHLMDQGEIVRYRRMMQMMEEQLEVCKCG
jgi:hypothetical protein